MRLAGFAMLVALMAGSASAQIVFKPTKPKPDVTQGAEDAIRQKTNELGADFNRDIRELPADTPSEPEKVVRPDTDPAKGPKAPVAKPCKDCVAPVTPH